MNPREPGLPASPRGRTSTRADRYFSTLFARAGVENRPRVGADRDGPRGNHPEGQEGVYKRDRFESPARDAKIGGM